MPKNEINLSGYYNAYNVDSTEDQDYGCCTSVEIMSDNGEWFQIGFYYDLDHACVEKVSILKKGHEY